MCACFWLFVAFVSRFIFRMFLVLHRCIDRIIKLSAFCGNSQPDRLVGEDMGIYWKATWKKQEKKNRRQSQIYSDLLTRINEAVYVYSYGRFIHD